MLAVKPPPPSLSRSNVNIVVAVCVSELFDTEHHTARSPSQGRTYRTRSGRCCGFRNTNHPCRLSFQSTSARKRSVKVPIVYIRASSLRAFGHSCRGTHQTNLVDVKLRISTSAVSSCRNTQVELTAGTPPSNRCCIIMMGSLTNFGADPSALHDRVSSPI